MNKKLIYIFIFLFLISFASAQVYKTDTEIDLKVPFEIDGRIANTSATCNISILYPNASFLKDEVSMTNLGSGVFNITILDTETNSIGEYTWVAFCCEATQCAGGTGTFEVNPSGTTLTTSQGIIYFLALLVVLVLFIMALYGAIAIPGGNHKSNDDKVIGINDLKYVKLFLWFISYALFLFLLIIGKSISHNFLFFNEASSFFDFTTNLFVILLFPVIIVGILVMIINGINDKKTQQLLERGLSPR